LPFPRRALRLGCSPSMTVRPAAATARASPTPKLRLPSIDTTTRGPGARSPIQASNSAKPELSLPIFRVPIGVPVGFQVRASAFLAVHMVPLLRGTLRRRDSADAEERWQLRLGLRLSPLLAECKDC
jgi:hypothetical protein